MPKLLSTGISGFDAQLGGGVPPRSVHLILAEPMNAMEMFMAHFAGAGATCDYFSTDAREEDVRDVLTRYAGKADIQIKDEVKVPGELAPDARIVLDSFTGLSLAQTESTAWEALDGIKRACRKGGGTAIVAAIQGAHPPELVARLKVWADGIVELGFDRQGFTLYPYLKITKMRGIPGATRFLLFKETDQGLFMESTRRVF